MKRSARAHIVAFGAAFVAFVAINALWIANLRLGPSVDGWVAGAMVLAVPLSLIVLTLIWFFIRAAMHGRMQWRPVSVLAVTVVVPLVILTVYCGPIACYAPGQPNHLLGWFIVLGVPLIALTHHFVLNSYPAEPEHG